MPKALLNIDRTWLQKIENIMPRLKWSISPLKIIQWLENFDEMDRESAYDILLVLEYISFPELQYRLDEQLTLISEDISLHSNILIVPYGKFGKSATLLTYPLRNTSSFKNFKKRVLITADFANVEIRKNTVLIMLDDFIGSGDTFIKEYNRFIKPWADSKNIKKRYLLTALIMHEAMQKLTETFGSEIKVFSEKKYKIFDSQKSPFQFFDSLENVRTFNSKYGSTLNSFPTAPYSRPLGYKDSESLVTFVYGTPNNTLPIIWASNGWSPLFARNASTKMADARKQKRSIAFYIGLMNRLGLDLYEDKTILIDGKRNRKYNHKIDHSLLLVIKLKLDNVDHILMAQILGVTLVELQVIFNYGRKKGYFNLTSDVTTEGSVFFNRLKKLARENSFRSDNEENFRMKNISYLPRVFKGVA